MTAEQASLRTTHANHYLFSDHYLNHVAPARSDWRDADVREVLSRLIDAWNGYVPAADNEAQTEDEWVRPVLELLGWKTLVQPAIQTPLGPRTPDYLLFVDDASRQAVKERAAAGPLSEAGVVGSLAVADAKAWERRLDKPLSAAQRAKGPKVSDNPSFQIDFYIRHTALPWGILTNGRHWQLFHTDSSKKLDVFYEVDLPALIEQASAPGATAEDVAALKYFWLFFRPKAFAERGWLASVLAESEQYQRGVSDHLKEQVYEALGALAQGFLDFPANGLDRSPETLKAIYDHSLILLYRLLFTLYAEDRGLLPVRDSEAYRDSVSLHALKLRIAHDLAQGKAAAASVATIWPRLRALWQVIDAGNADLGVQAYNGGLFSPTSHAFLERYQVGDLHLRQAIDRMARVRDAKTGKVEFVDYRDLEIRHLGSIYEGLLEYRLQVADAPQVVRKVRGKEVYEPVGEGEQADIAAGQAFLITDKGERKATGSYYTPDYIVQYIVEHTVGPVLEEATAAHDGDPAAQEQAILRLNVLDPAMGSGHFLVAATDFMARHLVSLALPSAEAQREEGGELDYWRRRVAQACIYGVDLNPLAVELAKLSLWLATVAKDKPLSFLDHHLRAGNSLIGARVEDLLLGPSAAQKGKKTRAKKAEAEAAAAGQLSMLDDAAFAGQMRAAVRQMGDLEAIRGETVEEVQEAERIYEQSVRALTERWRTLANVHTARHFGLEVDDVVLKGLTEHVLREGFEVPQYAEIVARAEQLAGEHRFFHWELEFPEVFFDEHGRIVEGESGFDGVVGNPPYVSAWSMSSHEDVQRRAIELLTTPQGILTSHWDLYVAFTLKAIWTLRGRGLISYILPNPVSREKYAANLRKYVLEQSELVRVLSFGDINVFEEVHRQTVVLVIRKQSPGDAALVTIDEISDENQRGWLASRQLRQLVFRELPGATVTGSAT